MKRLLYILLLSLTIYLFLLLQTRSSLTYAAIKPLMQTGNLVLIALEILSVIASSLSLKQRYFQYCSENRKIVAPYYDLILC